MKINDLTIRQFFLIKLFDPTVCYPSRYNLLIDIELSVTDVVTSPVSKE